MVSCGVVHGIVNAPALCTASGQHRQPPSLVMVKLPCHSQPACRECVFNWRASYELPGVFTLQPTGYRCKAAHVWTSMLYDLMALSRHPAPCAAWKLNGSVGYAMTGGTANAALEIGTCIGHACVRSLSSNQAWKRCLLMWLLPPPVGSLHPQTDLQLI